MDRDYLFSRTIAGWVYHFYRDDSRPGVHVDHAAHTVTMSGPATVATIQLAISLCFEHDGLLPITLMRFLA